MFDALRDAPGEWAIFRRGVKHPGGIVENLKAGRYRGIQEGEIEVRSHIEADGLTTIYIRIRSSNGAT